MFSLAEICACAYPFNETIRRTWVLFVVYERIYRAMHYGAKCGLAIACCLSVCLSVCLPVTLVDHDHIGWKSWKLIARTISPTVVRGSSKVSSYSQGKMDKFWGDYVEVGWEKVACWGIKAAISLKRVKIEEKLLWGGYRKSPTLFPFFWVAAIFLLPVSPVRPRRRPFFALFLPV